MIVVDDDGVRSRPLPTVDAAAAAAPAAPAIDDGSADDEFELDEEFEHEVEEEFSHHGFGRHEFGGDSPLLSPRVARWVRYVPRAHPAGFVLGTAFVLISLTPSLIPRDYLFQGLASGISAALGYAVGVAGAWLLSRFGRSTHLADRLRRAAPVWFTPGTWLLIVLTAVTSVLIVLIAGAGWQRSIALFMGMQQTTTDGWLRAGPIMVVVATVLIGAGRAMRWAGGLVARVLRRRVHLPAPLAALVGTAIVVILVAVVMDTVVLRTGLRLADAAFSAANEETYPGVERPPAPTRSGSPASLVGWDTIGREGQRFVAGGRPPDQLAVASGHAPRDPIRTYVGLETAPTPQARAERAVAELDRTGAFGRSVVALVTTTGTGWIDDPVADSLELAYGGDTAIVATQYSYLPSWLSFVVDRARAQIEGRALFDAVNARIQAMPPDKRPRLLVFGESLGSQGSEAAFSSLADARKQADGVLWVGPPNSNRLWEGLTAAREPGSTEIRPVVDDGRAVRFGSSGADLARPVAPWDAPRVVYLQHPSDPIVWWSPDLLWRRPDWLAEPRGDDVSGVMDWFPMVTFWQVTIDMTNSLSVPDGHGHNYRGALLDGWMAVGAPPGWTGVDTERVRAVQGR